MPVTVIILGALGRMGSTLCRLASDDPEISLGAVVERSGYEHALKYDCIVGSDLSEVLPKVPGGVIIDFTLPEVTIQNALKAREFGNPAVIGTTGLNAEQLGILAECAREVPLFFAPNMSVGVNVLLKLLPQLVELLGPAYDVEISEIHHKHKKDAPSGTAVKLAQVLAEAKGWEFEHARRYCREGIIGERQQEEIGVQTLRGGDVVGDHTVFFFGPGERIEVTHRAHSRETFAAGALRAAKWVRGTAPGTALLHGGHAQLVSVHVRRGRTHRSAPTKCNAAFCLVLSPLSRHGRQAGSNRVTKARCSGRTSRRRNP
jgi:4-hydroxy-tetrahydrodipicolinate reductase